MKTKFIIWLFLAITIKGVGGCEAGKIVWRIITSPMNGIELQYPYYFNIQANEYDTIQVKCYNRLGSCYGYWTFESYLKNNIKEPIIVDNQNSNAIVFKISCTEGLHSFNLRYSDPSRSPIGNFTFNIHTLNLVGISELNPSNNFLAVYPNPASKEISISNLSNQILKINLISTMGEIVLTAYPNNNQTNINVEELPRGVYYLMAILEDKKRVSKKIIIE